MEWSNHDSPHAGVATDPASVHATNMKFGNLEFCVEVEEHDFSDPMELINGYCSCVSSESCQGIMPTVDKYLSNVATNMRNKEVTVVQDGHVYSQRGLLKGRTLFDTGAIDRSYISKAMVDHHREAYE